MTKGGRRVEVFAGCRTWKSTEMIELCMNEIPFGSVVISIGMAGWQDIMQQAHHEWRYLIRHYTLDEALPSLRRFPPDRVNLFHPMIHNSRETYRVWEWATQQGVEHRIFAQHSRYQHVER